MSAPRALAIDAVALQLARLLDDYERDLERMIAAWPDLERYRAVSAQVEQIRAQTGCLPEARLAWVELLIAHAELIHFLWRLEYGDHRSALQEFASVREHHAGCVDALRKRCLQAGLPLQAQRRGGADPAAG